MNTSDDAPFGAPRSRRKSGLYHQKWRAVGSNDAEVGAAAQAALHGLIQQTGGVSGSLVYQRTMMRTLADLSLRCADGGTQDPACFIRAMLVGNKHGSCAHHELRDLNRRVGSVAEINRLKDRDGFVRRLEALINHAPESPESLDVVHADVSLRSLAHHAAA
jgi:hypothetical protein